MHNHIIALALADARVAGLQRAATHATATVPPRRRRRALALLGAAVIATLAALAPTGALARPTHDSGPLETRRLPPALKRGRTCDRLTPATPPKATAPTTARPS